MPFDDLSEFDSERDDGLAAEALERSESPVCQADGGHVADVTSLCCRCEKYVCAKHWEICQGCLACFCLACAVKDRFVDGGCADCRDLPRCPSKFCGKPATFTAYGDGLFVAYLICNICGALTNQDEVARHNRPPEAA